MSFGALLLAKRRRIPIFPSMRTRVLVIAALLLAACSDGLGPVPAGTFGFVAGGFEHTCGLLGSGAAYCWGFNGSLQLGTGGANDRDTLPHAVSGGRVFTQIDAGQGHTCAITTSNDAYCWGSSNDGALGGGGTVPVTPDPVIVSGGLKFKAIALGFNHTCGLATNGSAYCWGDNGAGVLGQDTTVLNSYTPILVAGGRTYSAITSGDFHACAIAVGGAAYCWGSNTFGALGTGDSSSHGAPTAVAGGHLFKAIDGGNVHTCGLTTGGDVYCWGSGWQGQVGNGSRSDQRAPVKVGGGRTYTAVSVGANHSCALAVGGTLYCWGGDGAGQLAGTANETCVYGPGPTDNFPCTSTPTVAAGGQEFRALSAGSFHTCAVGTGGGAYCWGGNNEGQIGNGVAGSPVVNAARVSDP
jgi:alpha-tubulin suppressor-like RCC1 family protein